MRSEYRAKWLVRKLVLCIVLPTLVAWILPIEGTNSKEQERSKPLQPPPKKAESPSSKPATPTPNIVKPSLDTLLIIESSPITFVKKKDRYTSTLRLTSKQSLPVAFQILQPGGESQNVEPASETLKEGSNSIALLVYTNLIQESSFRITSSKADGKRLLPITIKRPSLAVNIVDISGRSVVGQKSVDLQDVGEVIEIKLNVVPQDIVVPDQVIFEVWAENKRLDDRSQTKPLSLNDPVQQLPYLIPFIKSALPDYSREVPLILKWKAETNDLSGEEKLSLLLPSHQIVQWIVGGVIVILVFGGVVYKQYSKKHGELRQPAKREERETIDEPIKQESEVTNEPTTPNLLDPTVMERYVSRLEGQIQAFQQESQQSLIDMIKALEPLLGQHVKQTGEDVLTIVKPLEEQVYTLTGSLQEIKEELAKIHLARISPLQGEQAPLIRAIGEVHHDTKAILDLLQSHQPDDTSKMEERSGEEVAQPQTVSLGEVAQRVVQEFPVTEIGTLLDGEETFDTLLDWGQAWYALYRTMKGDPGHDNQIHAAWVTVRTNIFRANGLIVIDETGGPFDPTRHEALNLGEGQRVVEVVTIGYQNSIERNSRGSVLRKAHVMLGR